MTDRGRRAIGVALVSLAAMLGLPRPAHAALDDDPLFRPFELRPVHGSVFVTGDMRSENRSSSGSTTRNHTFLFQEGIDLRTGGYIYHPNLFNWNGQVRLGLSQDYSRFGDEDRESLGTVLGYVFDGTLLRHKPLSLRVFSSYNQSQTNRDFADPIDYQTSRNGFEIYHRGPLNSSLLFERVTDDQSSDVRDTESETYRLRFQTEYRRENVILGLMYEHESIDETVGSGGSTTSLPSELDELVLTNTIYFGEGATRHSLTGQTRLFDRRGFFDAQSFSTNQTLSLSHAPDFNTFYTGSYRTERSQGIDETTASAAAGFNKRFYESLELGGRVFVEQEEFTGGSEERYGGELSAHYTKKTPIGEYRSTLSLSRTWEQEEADLGQRQIIGEPIVLTGADFVALSELNVVPGSIVVSNLTRTIVYVEGIHYNVRVTGPITEIQRIVLSPDPIPDGGTVLVDYSITQARDSETTRDRIVWTHRLEIEPLHLTPYVIFQYISEDLVGGEDPGTLDDMTSITLGVEYFKDDLFAMYEYETLSSTLSLSYDAHRVRARYNRSLNRDMVLSVGGGAEWLVYTNPEEFGLDEDEDYMNTYHAFGELTQRLNRSTLWRMRIDGRDVSGRQNTRHVEVSTGLEWRYRQLEFSIDGRYRFFEQDKTDGDVIGVEFQLRRYF